MPCVINGASPFSIRPGRWILSTSGAGAINLSWLVPTNIKMEQFTIHWSAAPTTPEEFVLSIDSSTGSAFDTVLRAEDPSIDSWTDFVCLDPFRWVPNDRVVFNYPNTDTNTVAFKILLVQVDN